MLRFSLESPRLVIQLAGLVMASLLILGACAPLPGPAVELTPSLEPAAPTPLVTPSPTPTAAPEARATAAGQGNVAAVPTPDAALPAQDAERIVFEARSATGEDLFSVKPDGADLRQITRDPGLNQEAACSPDGQRIAFTSWRGNTHYLYLLNADGSQERQLAGGPGNVAEPAWSPDGRQIVFSSEADKAFYVINTDGTGQERLPVTGDNLYAPAWSPDGQRLAYTSYARNAWDLHIARLDGSGDTNLTGGRAFYAHQAAWSPNGQQIAFYGTLGGGKTFEIYVMNADGSGVRRLTTPPDDDSWRNNGRPAWSPDGMQIVFHSDRGGGFDIWIMNADGSEQRQLTHGLNASNPCWLPGR